MAQIIAETSYEPGTEEEARRKRERRVVQEGTALWRRRKEELQRQKHREQRELQGILASYSPWGKPGGGAPCAATLRKKNVPLEPPELPSPSRPRCYSFGQLVHPSPWGRPGPGGVPWRDPKLQGVRFLESMGWTNNSVIDRLYKRNTGPAAVADMNKFYDDRAAPGIASETQPLQDPRNLYKEEIQVYELTGGVELVPLLTSRRYQSHPQTTRYLVTDATRPGYTIESLRALGVGNREYIADLAEQIRRKRNRALEERRIEQETCRRHFDTWKRLWGRPGHGAPIDHVQRNNLYNILHRPTIY